MNAFYTPIVVASIIIGFLFLCFMVWIIRYMRSSEYLELSALDAEQDLEAARKRAMKARQKANKEDRPLLTPYV